MFGDDDTAVHKKLRAAVDAGLRPMLCIGESDSEREQGITEAICALQLAKAFGSTPGAELVRSQPCALAYW